MATLSLIASRDVSGGGVEIEEQADSQCIVVQWLLMMRQTGSLAADDKAENPLNQAEN